MMVYDSGFSASLEDLHRTKRHIDQCSLGLKMDGNIPIPFFIFVRPFPYLWDPVSVFTKVEMRFLRLFPRNPVFIWN